ncbi:hypothetical protein [Streptosporangium roseum]|uniref:Uncharacterized protein n=1 Tax=Streptosporangium roseum (strain ATCC 12428 / DSM 43021 / JCM 3005 / KCTC 9067 / NCIMB 10171 / NRRL 2505 / NI 9100) TaxID=479432 RepID=D2ARK6_STRRD|nr:hypothetical protein [Streptosporangium roseum]ACZ90346.1 hypothetical protein Sros_7674 [Streptosporangium roseum DSM 43021]
MNTDRGGLAGFRLTHRTWTDELGTWSSAVAADGRPAGALSFDPRLIADPATRERLAGAVIADRGLAQAGVTGLVPIADLIAAQGEVWLLTAEPVNPTVADLLSETPGVPRPDAGSAAGVLVEIAQTLLAVHAAGLAHGALHPGTVVIAADGSARLVERGLADAIHGRPPAPERDVAAWSSLSRGLAASWAASSPGAAGLFERAAATASTHGLAPARDVLITGRDLLPPGFDTRDRLLETLHLWAAHDVRARDGRQASAPPPAPALPAPDEGDIVTLLHVPRSGESRTEDVVMRFGPGVPVETTAAQLWRAGRDQQQTEPPSDRLRVLGAPARRRRRRAAVSSAILALMVVAALVAWLLRSSAVPLAVTGLDVVAPKKTQGCGATVKIKGLLTTNGSAGEIRYQWKRSDRKDTIEQTDTVASGKTSHEVILQWSVKGEGSFKGTATLRLLSPLPEGKKLQDKATFNFKC